MQRNTINRQWWRNREEKCFGWRIYHFASISISCVFDFFALSIFTSFACLSWMGNKRICCNPKKKNEESENSTKLKEQCSAIVCFVRGYMKNLKSIRIEMLIVITEPNTIQWLPIFVAAHFRPFISMLHNMKYILFTI